MELSEFKGACQELIDQLEYYINALPSKGLKSDDCQRTYLKLKLSELEQAVNGTEKEDMLDVDSWLKTLRDLATSEEECYLDEDELYEYKQTVTMLKEHDITLPSWVKPFDELRTKDGCVKEIDD